MNSFKKILSLPLLLIAGSSFLGVNEAFADKNDDVEKYKSICSAMKAYKNNYTAEEKSVVKDKCKELGIDITT